MRYIQRMVLGCDEQEIRMDTVEGDHHYAGRHEDLLPLFSLTAERFSFRKRRSKLSIHDLIQDGSIQDTHLFSSYLQMVFSLSGLARFFQKIEVLVVVPTHTTNAEKDLWVLVLDQVGISTVSFCSQAIAGVVGAGFQFPIATFSLVLSIGWSSAEFTALVLDRSLFSLKLALSGKELTDYLAEEVYRQTGIRSSDNFWKKVVGRADELIASDPEKVAESFSALLKQERLKPPLELLQTLIQECYRRSCRRIQMQLLELTPTQLSLATSQGVLLLDEVTHPEKTSLFFSRELELPVYAIPQNQHTMSEGAVRIFSQQHLSEE